MTGTPYQFGCLIGMFQTFSQIFAKSKILFIASFWSKGFKKTMVVHSRLICQNFD